MPTFTPQSGPLDPIQLRVPLWHYLATLNNNAEIERVAYCPTFPYSYQDFGAVPPCPEVNYRPTSPVAYERHVGTGDDDVVQRVQGWVDALPVYEACLLNSDVHHPERVHSVQLEHIASAAVAQTRTNMDYVLRLKAENDALREQSAIDREMVANLKRQVFVLNESFEREYRQLIDADVVKDAAILRCDELEQQLTDADDFAEQLAISVLSSKEKTKKYERKSLSLQKAAVKLIADLNTQAASLETREKAVTKAHLHLALQATSLANAQAITSLKQTLALKSLLPTINANADASRGSMPGSCLAAYYHGEKIVVVDATIDYDRVLIEAEFASTAPTRNVQQNIAKRRYEDPEIIDEDLRYNSERVKRMRAD